ncbi:MAG: DUF421 domain-containing protein [Firmicutes bacterium]|nr:DUF421 domain-containing protein [Bacillota bacterium]
MELIYTITIKIVLGFIALHIITIVLGKIQISQLTPFYFISAIVLGEIFGNPLYEEDISFIYPLYAVALWGFLMLGIAIVTQKYIKTRSVLEGNPSIIIRNGQLDRDEMKKNRFDINELHNLLRQKDVFSVREVQYGILEQDGKLSVLKKSQYDTPTQKDLNLPPKTVYLPVTLISDGEVLWDNIKSSGFDEQWLKLELEGQGISSYKDVFYAEWLEGSGTHVVKYDSIKGQK